jgi:hypothetical protein
MVLKVLYYEMRFSARLKGVSISVAVFLSTVPVPSAILLKYFYSKCIYELSISC